MSVKRSYYNNMEIEEIKRISVEADETLIVRVSGNVQKEALEAAYRLERRNAMYSFTWR
jgi:predicted site-specific integrase-resolvase